MKMRWLNVLVHSLMLHMLGFGFIMAFLTVNGGEKMSKSLGNVITVRELINNSIDGES